MLRTGFALVLLAALAGYAAAQPVEMADLPPLMLPPVAPEGAGLPNGLAVSQPLQADLPDPKPAPVSAPPRADLSPAGPLPKSWDSWEVLLWWPQPQRLPPLLLGSRTGVPVLGGPDSVLLLGGGRSDPPHSTGGRFTLGWSLGEDRRTGFEISYLFTGTQTSHDEVGRSPVYLARPVYNPHTGAEDAVPVNTPWMRGDFQAWANTRIQSWGVTGLANLYAGECVRVHGTAGYRYFMVNEGLRFEQSSAFQGTDGLYRSHTADQIDAHNRFHGGELGLRTELVRGPFSLQLDTKVSLGRTVEMVRVGGLTVGTVEGPGGIQTQTFPGGVFGQPSNSGRTARSHFAVLPEGGLKVGYRLGERARFSVGYTVFYLSDAVRPGDQIDRVVDLAQLAGGASAERPLPLFVRSEYWVQGLSLGLEWRY